MLISFEGIDGSGKSTQISLLKTYLLNKGRKVSVYREPGGVQISEQIRNLLLNSNIEIHPTTEMLLFSAARSQLLAEKVNPDLKNKKIVILDRFYDSTTAYQGFGRNSIKLSHIHQINKIASLGREPDVTFYLRLSWEESKRRTAHMEEDRIEIAGQDFFKKVIQGFDHLSETLPRFKKIDASSTVTKIHRHIVNYIEVML